MQYSTKAIRLFLVTVGSVWYVDYGSAVHVQKNDESTDHLVLPQIKRSYTSRTLQAEVAHNGNGRDNGNGRIGETNDKK